MPPILLTELDALLDSYDAERRPVFESTARDFIAKSIENDSAFLHTYDPERDRAAFETAWTERSQSAVGEVHAFEPNYEGSPVVLGPVPTGGIQGGSALGRHMFSARAGHHLAPALLSDGRNVYQAFGQGFSLLAFGADATSVGAFVDAAAHLGLPLTVIQNAAQGERQRYAAPLVLVRPDQFVAWVGSGVTAQVEARLVLQRISGI